MADMLGTTLKAMGFDPQTILTQAAGLGAAFENLVRTQERIETRLAAIEAGQLAIMAAMGLYVPPADEATVRLIEVESVRHVQALEARVA